MREIVIITGATGFIGGFIVQKALEEGLEVHCLVRKSSDISRINQPGVVIHYYTADSLESLNKNFDDFRRKYGEATYFIHNAGITKALDTSQFDIINGQHTQRYALAARQNFPSLKRFVLMSSLAAQGPGNSNTLIPISVQHQPKPDTFYGRSKLLAENLLKSVEGLPWTILRPTGVYGPYDRDYLLFLKALQIGIEPVMGFKEQHLSFVYATDLVEAIFLALKTNTVGHTFLVSDGQNYTSKQYGNIAREILRTHAIRVPIPLAIVWASTFFLEQIARFTREVPTLNKDKYQTMKAINWKVDIEETRKLLNYQPQIDLRRGLELSVEWYRENRWLN